jgi:hypothetical protein
MELWVAYKSGRGVKDREAVRGAQLDVETVLFGDALICTVWETTGKHRAELIYGGLIRPRPRVEAFAFMWFLVQGFPIAGSDLDLTVLT